MKRPNNLDEQYGWCRKKHHGVFIDKVRGCPRCETEKRRTENGKCCALLHHGPGHQSSTYCTVKGKHVIHCATYGNYDSVMKWRGMRAFTGYFDEPKE